MKYLQILGVVAISLIVGFGAGNIATNNCEADLLDAEPLAAVPTDLDVSGGVTEDGYYFLGAENAPITMIEYTDYQCPYCQAYTIQTFPEIKQKDISTGRVKYIVKDLPITGHTKAYNASNATRCSGEQGLYWEMHEKIFLAQRNWSGASDVDATFAEYAEELGADKETFEVCIATNKYAEQIAGDVQEANSVGISGTPSFTVNGFVAIGAQPYKNFAAMFERF
jgi:protein-disulfide isomerase